MPSKVNRVPPGLLSYLDIKAQGRSPDTLPDTLQAVTDLTQFYLQDRIKYGAELLVRPAGTAVTATYNTAAMIVPDQQTLRLVLTYTCYVSTGAADTTDFTIYLQRSGSNVPFVAGGRVVLGNNAISGASFIQPFWMKYDDRLGFWRTQTSAGNLTYGGSIQYVDFAV